MVDTPETIIVEVPARVHTTEIQVPGKRGLKGNTGDKGDKGDTGNMSAGGAIGGQTYINYFTSTASSSPFYMRPSDWGVGKPQIGIFKHGTASRWDILLFDGTNNAGTINISVTNFTLNNNPIASIVSGVLNVPATSASPSGIKLYEDTDNGGNFVGLYAPNTLAADLFLKLPAVDGAANMPLCTDGAGNLLFQLARQIHAIGPTATPVNNNDVAFELTSNTSLTLKVKGGDGVVRSVVLTLT